MVNHFDMAREVARLVDAGKSGDEIAAEMRCLFPTATVADIQRAKRIGLDRVEMLEEDREEDLRARCRAAVETAFAGCSEAEIDAAFKRLLPECRRLAPMSAQALFPKPDKTKS